MQDLKIIQELGKQLGMKFQISKSDNRPSLRTNEFILNESGKITSVKISSRGNPDESNNNTSSKQFLSSFKSAIRLLAQLEQLEYLDLSGNNLVNIDSLKILNNILFLDLSDNNIEDINVISELRKLNCLNLSKNKISYISALVNCKEISILFLYKNNIAEVPKEVFNFLFNKRIEYNIEEIKFLKSCFIKIKNFEPAAIARDYERYLGEGNTRYNSLNTLLEYLRTEFLGENPLISPPFSIIKSGEREILNYYTQIEKEKGKTKRLFEAKLLVIGEGGTGKTSFIRKIQDANAELPKDKDTTFGILIGKWNYFTTIYNGTELEEVNFHVNLWDFGGQKIYQGTHQIFFSDKSFYVLIADTREQKTDFSYWINTVEQLGGDDSSLVIILNKKYGHEQKFDESGYRSHFGNLIKEVIQLDLKNDIKEIYEVQDKIKHYLRQLPSIGDALPSSWVQIREELSNEKANFISFDHFRQICSKYDITDYSMIHTLSVYFNQIGAFTHYIDIILLQERIYLNSNWLVKTVYEVLDNEIAKSKKGRLTGLDIKLIWGDNELQYEINKLTQLMHKFGLMYHIPNSDNYIVPAHLPTVTPYDHWRYIDDISILQFIYEFDKFMPQGIMSRLIVALNHHIENHDLVWHRGVNIESNGAHAEILESYGGANKFEIRIAGQNKLELLAIIRERFAEVLKPFNKLKYKQLVPCVCKECIGSHDPAFHDYGLLLKFKDKGIGSQCSKTGEMVNIEELLKTTERKIKRGTLATQEKGLIRTISIFLASSSELLEDRRKLREFLSVENDRLHTKEIYLKLVQWEYFFDAMSRDRLQKEYNDALKECDIFLGLFFTKVGKYTAEEFENAFGQFKETGKPHIFTYFKDAPINTSQIKEEDIKSKFKFEKKLRSLGHFVTMYRNTEDLINQLKRQLEEIIF